ncbi:MAG TPA: hypothetical protein VGG46_03985 [Terriglobales bacterium]|jgi:hypothetical protein
MKISQLIEALQKLDPTLLVTRPDGENINRDVTKLEVSPDYHHSELEVLVIS